MTKIANGDNDAIEVARGLCHYSQNLMWINQNLECGNSAPRWNCQLTIRPMGMARSPREHAVTEESEHFVTETRGTAAASGLEVGNLEVKMIVWQLQHLL